MYSKKNLCIATIALVVSLSIVYACKTMKPSPEPATVQPAQARVLVFTKTAGYYHESIPTGAAAIMQLGNANQFSADTTSSSEKFTEDELKNYRAVVFLNTTMNVLNADQQVAFERYIQAGGGFMGIHAATDTEYEWPWYNKLVGAYFASHPKQQNATINVTDRSHISTAHLPEKWQRFDEWYNFKSVQPGLNVLAWLDEKTYEGGTMGDKHPFAWYHEYDGGRAFYTAGGHTKESYSDSLFLKHLLGGLKYAMGNNSLDFSKSYSVKSPEDNRFTKTVLSDDLNEPMELAVAPDGRVFITERSGKCYVYSPASNSTKLLREFPVKAVDKYLNGLIGVTLDPDFSKNNFIYFFYSSSTGENYHQNVSRFTLAPDGSLDTTSEKVIIKIPIDLEVSAHTGGSLAWDKYKNLYISTGDNTVPFESDGYAPIDERNGRLTFDAQRSSANTNDLRGKILRIHPEPDGTYTIPEGNLFPKGTPNTRPEIYVMGCRNPYRIAIDTVTSYVYWGEVGPDAGRDSRHGPRGYDEINQARKPGNFGWPYFVGNTKAYNDSNFATKEIGDLFKVEGPVNNSPNNTGLQTLPSPQSAMIWYPYSLSDEFPALGEGGRCAMSGPFYHYNANSGNEGRLPQYYDKSLFIYDWMRNWVFAVRLDEQSNFQRLEPFMATNGDFRRPVDIEIGPDGVMYMLEYGSVYGIDNVDARLVKITFNAGNRAPVAKIAAKDSTGTAPFILDLVGDKSYDNDDEPLKYEWSVNGKAFSSDKKTKFNFTEKGIYQVVLKVTDSSNVSDSDTMRFIAGNNPPEINISTTDNSSFYFPDITGFNYKVEVKDKEEKKIEPSKLKITRKYIAKVAGNQKEQGHQMITADYNLGKILIAGSDCKACHQLDAKSVGPSFMDVSRKYRDDKNAPGYLANKIITGGGGVWGEHAMSAHPQLSKEEATEMAKFILSLSNDQKEELLKPSDSIALAEHESGNDQGRYVFTASYTDDGNSVQPLTGTKTLVLRPSKVQAEDADRLYNLIQADKVVYGTRNGAYLLLKNIDLNDVHHATARLATRNKAMVVELRAGSTNGKLVAAWNFTKPDSADAFVDVASPVTNPGGINDLYLVLRAADTTQELMGAVDWVRFEGGRKVAAIPQKKKAAPAQQKSRPVNPTVVKPENERSAGTASQDKGKQLIMQSDCKACHAQDKKVIGPSYDEVYAKYKNKRSMVPTLADKIIKGGAGVWGQIPMTPHPQITKAEATAIVNFILSGKKVDQ